jgi:hypothetical protein
MFPILADFLSTLRGGGGGGGKSFYFTFNQVQTKVFFLKLLKPGSDLLK